MGRIDHKFFFLWRYTQGFSSFTAIISSVMVNILTPISWGTCARLFSRINI